MLVLVCVGSFLVHACVPVLMVNVVFNVFVCNVFVR